MKVLHIINALSVGGAETMLWKLLSRFDRREFDCVVVSLINMGLLRKSIGELGVQVQSAGMSRSLPSPCRVRSLIKLVKEIRPDLIQGWMPHSNLAALFVARFLPGHVPVVWNIRQSIYNLKYETASTALLIRFGALLSRRVDRVLYNSHTGAEHHERLGYSTKKTVVIPNGFDDELFCPDAGERCVVRKELGVPARTPLIGLIGRYHPMKDHETFLKAASMLDHTFPEAQYVLAGRNVDNQNAALRRQIEELGIVKRVFLLGHRTDVPRLLAALDIVTSSSYTEGFPNAIGEAMACGVPCVVTDVGDSARIVGNTGLVVPPRNPRSLSNAWREMLEMGEQRRLSLGQLARKRIKERYSLDTVVERYTLLYQEVLRGRGSEA